MDKKLVPISKEECCGCTMCVDVCPVNAISIVSDEEGFSYPKIDKDICVNCGLCGRTCAFANRQLPQKPDVMPKAFVSKHKNQSVRMKSRSGAFFVSCSDFVLKNGGAVYGCILDNDLKAKHIRTQDKAMRDKMCGSKYVQSDTSGIFPLIKKDLENGLFVLFSGTGCQVHAVNAYLEQKKVNTDKFYSIDIVCHGVPTPKLFEDFKAYTEKKYKGKIESFDFRDKEKRGWDGNSESAVINGKKHTSQAYYLLFTTNAPLRPSCYNCKYACIEHTSDFTIADAWGVKKNLPEFNDNRGVSLVIVNSEKAENLLKTISDDNIMKEIDLNDWLQPNLLHPSKINCDREQFWNDYKNNGIEYLMKHHIKYSVKDRARSELKYIARKIKNKKGYYLP